MVDNTIKFEKPVEVRDAVNERNPITKKKYTVILTYKELLTIMDPYFFFCDLAHDNATNVVSCSKCCKALNMCFSQIKMFMKKFTQVSRVCKNHATVS